MSEFAGGVTLVIPAHNSEQRLPDCLEAIAQQTYEGPLEVIVVTDRCSDATERVARSWGARVIGNDGPRGPASARNRGIEQASHRIVAFTDDDCRPEPGWLSEMVRVLETTDAVAVGGRTIASDRDHFVCRYLTASDPFAPLELDSGGERSHARRLLGYLKSIWMARPTIPRPRPVAATGIGNFAMQTQMLRDLDALDETYSFSGEDFDLCRRLNASHPGRLFYCPSAVVHHEFTPRITDSLRRAYRYALGNVALRRRHPELGPVVFPIPVLWLLGSLITAIAAPMLWVVLPSGLIPLCYPKYVRLAWAGRTPEPFLYAYLQVAHETAGNWGFIIGTLRSP